MGRHSLTIGVAVASAGLVVPWLALASPAGAAPMGTGGGCSAGARTLAAPGSLLYPDTGNGGYTSLHTLVHLVYDATRNKFLPGNRVVLTDRATQCLTSFSLDFERTSADTSAGPDMTVSSVSVNGVPGPVPLRTAGLPRRPERAERPESRRARGIRVQPGRRPGSQPAASGLHAGAAEHRRHGRLDGRHPVPGQQAGDHAAGADQARRRHSPSR